MKSPSQNINSKSNPALCQNVNASRLSGFVLGIGACFKIRSQST